MPIPNNEIAIRLLAPNSASSGSWRAGPEDLDLHYEMTVTSISTFLF